jgi:hypothetical protein
MFDLEVEIL